MRVQYSCERLLSSVLYAATNWQDSEGRGLPGRVL